MLAPHPTDSATFRRELKLFMTWYGDDIHRIFDLAGRLKVDHADITAAVNGERLPEIVERTILVGIRALALLRDALDGRVLPHQLPPVQRNRCK